jgi:DNA modification methylase
VGRKRTVAQTLDKTSSAPARISVEYRAISDLKFDPLNPRIHTAKQVQQIADSIELFDFNVPILIDRELNIVAGHGRAMASRLLGRSEVPTICLGHLSEAQIRAFMIADNKLTENAIWDEKLLAEQLRDLSIADLDFDLTVTGFEMAEIDLKIQGLESFDNRDEVEWLPPSPEAVAVTRFGGGWLLRNHKILCASALESTAYDELFSNSRATMIFTDPPYNLPVGSVSGFGATQYREFAMGAGEMTEQEFIAFLARSATLMARYSVPGSIHFICMGWQHLWELLTAGREVYSELKNICIWAKDNAGMGALYRNQIELVTVFKNGQAPHVNNILLGKFGRNRTNLWSYPNPRSFTKSGEDEPNRTHPTPKNTALVSDAILDCSMRNDLVLDPYLGSGTTLISAENTGRRCYGLEIDPLYVDVIIRRSQKLTGEAARQTGTGRTFNEIEEEVKGQQ